MRLTYRGLFYETPPQKIEMAETNLFVQYRGLTYNIRRPVNLATSPQRTLKYRGISYTIGQVSNILNLKRQQGFIFQRLV